MTLRYNLTGSDRKRLVTAISEITGAPAKYLGAPSFGYQVDYFTIDRNGGVTFDDRADSEEIENLIETLDSQGFKAEPQAVEASEPVEPTPAEVDGLCISMPASLFTETTLQNLKDIIASKGNLIRKALGVDELPVEVGDTKVSFPWFAGMPTPEEVKAYDHFICALCEMARNQKRITAKERDTGNDKYAFRCFLLRLGFIGPEFKQERKILLRNLTGSSAFKSVPQKEVADDAASE
nr:MAG TPA: Putative amidoligase enzyme [Caudoviricetes sp.]